MLRRIANAWGHHDPPAAADWLMTRERTRDRANALGSVTEHWIRWDYDSLRAWLNEQERDVTFDRMWANYVRTGAKFHKFRVDWPELLAAAERIADPHQQRKEVYWVLQRWYIVDPEAVLAWFDANPGRLAEKVKDRLGIVPDREREMIEAAMAERAAADGTGEAAKS